VGSAEIEKAVAQGVFGAGKWFDFSAELSEAYAALREAQYLSYLVNDNLATYIMDRIADAVALQRVPDNAEFSRKLATFRETWDGDKMAKAFRHLS
jgi:hypothetical protein